MTEPRIDVSTPEGAALAGLIASLADNKAAMGRRYGEWAVSAPTLESAVAAAAMAQDELGHARSTYPLLKQIGASEASEDGYIEGGCHLPILDAELPDWEAFVAVNLAVDGALTTFIEATVDSSFEPLAQRARKMLQEEAAHGVHAAAWTRRLGQADPAEASPFAERLAEAWAQASRWFGPDHDPGFAAAVESEWIAATPSELRRRLRPRLAEVLEPTRLRVELPEPTTWSGWSPERRR